MKWTFYITFAFSLILIITGFLLPPMGVIDGSVFVAVGELTGFVTIWRFLYFLEKRGGTLKKGDLEITINDDDN